VAVADFNHDGKPDIVWRNTQTGANEIWLMNGFSVTSTLSLPAQGIYWMLAGAADFNGDGHPDLIFSPIRPPHGTGSL
jgi:hypothetical protein